MKKLLFLVLALVMIICVSSASAKDVKNTVSFEGKDVLPQAKMLKTPKADTFSRSKLDGPFCGIDYCAL